MAFASLDYYYAKMLVPTHEGKDFPNGSHAPDGSVLGDYIYKRSLHSLLTPSASKFLRWTLTRRDGMFSPVRAIRRVEIPKLKRSIDDGNPVVLGLIAGSKISEITKSHQVVAYGYDEPCEGEMVIYVYDSNSPDQEVIIVLNRGNPYLESSNGLAWRGFFVQDYRFRRPVYVDLVVEGHDEMGSSSGSPADAHLVINRGQFSANLKYWARSIADDGDPGGWDLVLDPGESTVIPDAK